MKHQVAVLTALAATFAIEATAQETTRRIKTDARNVGTTRVWDLDVLYRGDVSALFELCSGTALILGVVLEPDPTNPDYYVQIDRGRGEPEVGMTIPPRSCAYVSSDYLAVRQMNVTSAPVEYTMKILHVNGATSGTSFTPLLPSRVTVRPAGED